MKRLLVLALLALGLTIVVVPMASPARPNDADAQGPPCGEITNGEAVYSSDGTVITFDAFLLAPACSFVTYSFFVTDTSGEPIPAETVTQDTNCTPDPTDGGCVHFVYTLASSGPDVVCFYTTTEIGGHLVDRAPNASQPTCPESSPSHSVDKGSSSGASGGFG